MNAFRLFAVAILLCAIAVELPAFSTGNEADVASAGVDVFREHVAHGEYRAIYAKWEPEMKKAVTPEDLGKAISGFTEKLGAVKSSKQINQDVNDDPNGAIVTLNYETEFEKGKGEERFVFRIKQDGAYLIKYHVGSKALSLDPKKVM